MPTHHHITLNPTQIFCHVVTLSDTRTIETDKSGQLIHQLLKDQQFNLRDYVILKDEAASIQSYLREHCGAVKNMACILNGGTGISPRDQTFEAIEELLEKKLPGFGEIFRNLSYAEIGAAAVLSRATAGIYRNTVIFSIPGSSKGVQLAMTQLILPLLPHVLSEMNK